MSDPQTNNILLAIPLRASDVGTWDIPLNSNFAANDGFTGGVQSLAITGIDFALSAPSGTVVPSAGPTQAQNAVLQLTGTPSANVQITLPFPGYYIIDTTVLVPVAFTVTFRAVASGEVIGVPYGSVKHIYNDGTNVRFANLQEVGTYMDYAGSGTPLWITSCTKPPFLNCDGTTFNGTTYPVLAAILGGTTLPDMRGVARYTLNQGTGRLTSAGSGLDGNTLLANKFTQAYTLITTNLPPYTPADSSITSSAIVLETELLSVTVGGTPVYVSAGGTPANQTPTITFTGAPQGGTSTPFGVVGPGTVSGITLIRAG